MWVRGLASATETVHLGSFGLLPELKSEYDEDKANRDRHESGVSDRTGTALSCEYSGRWCENSLPLSGFHAELN